MIETTSLDAVVQRVHTPFALKQLHMKCYLSFCFPFLYILYHRWILGNKWNKGASCFLEYLQINEMYEMNKGYNPVKICAVN